MGALSKGLVRWVRAMNGAVGKAGAEKAAADTEIQAAFQALSAAWFSPRGAWDKGDHLANEILQAFDRSQFGD